MFAYTEYETYELITPNVKFGKLDGFDVQLAVEIQKDLASDFEPTASPPPRPEPDQTVDGWLCDVESWRTGEKGENLAIR